MGGGGRGGLVKALLHFYILGTVVIVIHVIITKIYLYNFDPFKPPFYIVKLGFTGLYIIFLFLLKNVTCGYALEPPRF